MNRRSAVACAVSDLDIPDVGRPTDGRQQRTIEINRFDCEFIRNGGLGRISKVELSNNPGPILKPDFPEEPVPDELDWNLFCGPTPLHHIFIVIFSSTAQKMSACALCVKLPMLETVVRGEAQLHAAQCLVMLRRWQLDRPGENPSDLGSIVKAAGMNQVPRDPYGDGPLRIAQLGNETVIYSIGNDGRDDKAQADWNHGQQAGDFIFRMKRTP